MFSLDFPLNGDASEFTRFWKLEVCDLQTTCNLHGLTVLLFLYQRFSCKFSFQ